MIAIISPYLLPHSCLFLGWSAKKMWFNPCLDFIVFASGSLLQHLQYAVCHYNGMPPMPCMETVGGETAKKVALNTESLK